MKRCRKLYSVELIKEMLQLDSDEAYISGIGYDSLRNMIYVDLLGVGPEVIEACEHPVV